MEILKLNGLSEAVAVVAVGGYGREQQFPFSDLDLLFLLPDDVKDKDLKTISEVIGNLWSLGLTVGYSVRKIEECLEQADIDITAQTAMLESRLISGNAELFKTYSDTIERSRILKKFYGQNPSNSSSGRSTTSPLMLWNRHKEAPGGL